MSALRPTLPLLRRTTRTLPGEQRLNRKVRPDTKPNLKDTRKLPPRLPKHKAGLRIRLIKPPKGFNVRTVGYRIVVNDGYASPRRKPVEQIGNYDPRQRAFKTPAKSLLDDGEIVYQKRLEWNAERLSYWLAQGAQPSPRITWLMQQAGVSLDMQVHKDRVASMSRVPSRFDEYEPDVHMPNDPKHRARLEMRAKARFNRAISLEPGSEAWLEAQMLKSQNAEAQEFAAAQREPYPLVPPGLEKGKSKMAPIYSRYAREYPVWIARASDSVIDMRAAALGRPDITKKERSAGQPRYDRARQTEGADASPEEYVLDPYRLPLERPAESKLTERLARERAGRRGGTSGPAALYPDA